MFDYQQLWSSVALGPWALSTYPTPSVIPWCYSERRRPPWCGVSATLASRLPPRFTAKRSVQPQWIPVAFGGKLSRRPRPAEYQPRSSSLDRTVASRPSPTCCSATCSTAPARSAKHILTARENVVRHTHLLRPPSLDHQSNMQYTPRSMSGMNNLTAELAAADAYADR